MEKRSAPFPPLLFYVRGLTWRSNRVSLVIVFTLSCAGSFELGGEMGLTSRVFPVFPMPQPDMCENSSIPFQPPDDRAIRRVSPNAFFLLSPDASFKSLPSIVFLMSN